MEKAFPRIFLKAIDLCETNYRGLGLIGTVNGGGKSWQADTANKDLDYQSVQILIFLSFSC